MLGGYSNYFLDRPGGPSPPRRAGGPSASTVIERREFDWERREFLRTYLEKADTTFEATFSDPEKEPK